MANRTEIKPYISASTIIPEVTPRAIILGIVLGIVLAAANAYLGLYAGMTVGASIPAAVISMGILRGVLKKGTILENNMVQTMASTGESLAAGVIFTVPAMLIAGVWTEVRFWPTMFICLTGGLLGILFMIPLRRPHIIEDEDLKFPEGQACFEVLKAGEDNASGTKPLLGGAILGAIFKFLIGGTALIVGSAEKAFVFGKTIFFLGTDISAALMATGYIVGLNVGTLVFGGSLVGWLAVMVLGNGLDTFSNPLDDAWKIWSTQIRYYGVGTMALGGVWSLIKIRETMVRGVKEAFLGYKNISEETQAPIRTEQNMSNKSILIITALTVAAIFGLYLHLTQSIPITVISTICMFVMSFLFVAVASYICGLVGSSNSPVSGMTICALLFTGGLLLLIGMSGDQAIIATLGVAGVVCCATCTSGDIAQDLKTGYLCGATPRNQQWMEIIGTIGPALCITPILIVLNQAYGIGTGAPGALKAPQAGLFASLVQGFFGKGSIPWNYVWVGAAIGVVVIILDIIQEKRGSNVRFPIMPFAIGMYLPMTVSVPIFLGGLIRYVMKGTDSDKGTLAAAGMIAGESLMGVTLAVVIFVAPGFFPIKVWEMIGLSHGMVELLSLGAFICTGWYIANWIKKGRAA